MCFPDDVVFAKLTGKLVDTANHQTKDDYSPNRERKHKASPSVGRRIKVAETNGENSHITVIQRIDVAPALDPTINSGTAG